MSEERAKILVVDDDPSLRNMMSIVLKKEGYDITTVDSAQSALNILKKEDVGLLISDIKMPEISGIELLRKVKSIQPDMPVLMITAYSSTNDAVEAMKLGAEDYISKPFNLDELKIIIHKALYKKSIERENVELKAQLTEREQFENIIGKTPSMRKIFDLIDTVAKTDSTILISGKSGTGKELIAKAIHNKSQRRNNKFVSINCSALPENLLESELFGHIKGSFTDAFKDKKGLFEEADSGTLFLDEIGEMSQNMQVKLLRAIQERKIRRVGSNEEIAIDVRIISATNKDLLKSMQEGEFRSDLFYRLNVIYIHVPELRDRKEDIPLLMQFFLKVFNERINKNIEGYDRDVVDLFQSHSWPGNVRELENYVERAVTLERGKYITLKSLPEAMVYDIHDRKLPGQDLKSLIHDENFDFIEYVDGIQKKIIISALDANSSNIKKTAEMLKLSYRQLRYLIDKFHLK
jgi:two-component system response regulator PilR (NtrC family)